MSDGIDWNETPAIDWTEEDDFEPSAGPSHREEVAHRTDPTPLMHPVKSLPDSYTQYETDCDDGYEDEDESEVDPEELQSEAKTEARENRQMVRSFSFQECRMPTIPESQVESGQTTPRAEHINWYRRKMEAGQITPTGRSSPVQDLEGDCTDMKDTERALDQSRFEEEISQIEWENKAVFDSDEEDKTSDWSGASNNEGPSRRSMSLDFHDKDFAAQFSPDQASTSRQPLNRHTRYQGRPR